MRIRIRKSINYVKQKGILLGIVLGVGIGIFSTSAAFAAIPDGDGVIHACRNNLLATLRIIDSASASCNGTETAMSWNSASTGQLVANLVGADFTSTSLAYRNLSGQDIHGGNFTSSVLSGANLTGANLSLSGMGPSGTTVLARNTNFTNANLNNIELLGIIDLTGATLSGVTLDGSSFAQGSTIIGGDFRLADLTNAQFHGNFDMSNFSDIDFRVLAQHNNTIFTNTNLTGALFNSMDLGSDTQFHNVNLTNTNFTGATVGSHFRAATITSTNFTNANFIDADLQSVDFSGATVTGTTWTNTWCPDGTFSGNNGNTCIGHLAV
jgi:uncharacterized protein YjbI with pentapeptide repeats